VERIEALKGPNALMFGRGNGGGVINRVTKTAGFEPFRDVSVTAGSFGEGRLTLDVDQPLGARAAVRLNGVYERAGSFRDFGALERYGVNPTATLLVGPRTIVTLAYEHVRDRRVADRGIPSFRGFPADVSRSTYFGDPLNSFVRARVDSLSASIDHQSGPWTWRSRTLAGSYERGYQNFVPGAVTADRRFVSLSAYNNDTARVNAFNQTDVTYAFQTGELRHTLLSGVELGRQATVNFRNTGYFDEGTTSILVPRDRPTIDASVSFRQSATDADNHMRAAIAAAYAQDQVELSRFVRVIAGLRVEAFDLAYHDNRTGADLARLDRLVSPRAGLVVKPRPAVSLYGSYTVSQLPGSGDQFASLTSVTEQLEPEAFTSYEAGAKWDVGPGLSLTAAAYRLDRTHTRSIDPNDATRIVQTGSQRTNGIEAGVAGRITSAWQMAGGYAWQDAFVTSATASAAAGARAAQVPRHTLSLWNLYQVNARIGAGIGIVGRTDMFAAIDDAVVLPGYTDVDAALYVALTPRLRLQANVENVFDRIYYVNADNNTNISPGAPRSLRIALSAHF
jgi:catecholate siderophore receptor